MAEEPVAYPFVHVRIDTSKLVPVAQRSPGVIAVVGKTAVGAAGGQAAANVPRQVSTLVEAETLFASRDGGGVVAETPLYAALKLAMVQDPQPSRIYGVRVDGDNYAAALQSLEAADDVTFVSLAREVSVGNAAGGGNAATNLMALRDHVSTMSSQGNKRVGVAMVDPQRARSVTYVDDVKQAVGALKEDNGRMVLVAARGADGDTATAAMAAMAAYPPHVSMVLKKVKGIRIPVEQQYSPSEVKQLSAEGINPIIDPTLIPGESLHFAEGKTFTTDAALRYIDIVRVLDDIDFRLKAGLIGQIGDARITKGGLTSLRVRCEEILGTLRGQGVIADFSISIPVLDVLMVPEAAWQPADADLVRTARQNRSVDMFVSVTYGPAVHLLRVTLAPTFGG